MSETEKDNLGQYIHDLETPQRFHSSGLGQTLSKLHRIEKTLIADGKNNKNDGDGNAIDSLSSTERMRAMGYDLRTIRNSLESLSNMNVIEEEDKERKWITQANEDLAVRIASTQVMDMTVRQVFDQMINTWHRLFVHLLSTDNPFDIDNSLSLETNIRRVFRRLYVLFCNKEDMFYVGLFFVLLSVFVYYILASG